MTEEPIKLSVSPEIVRPIVEAKIQAAIADALKVNPLVLIDAIVTQALNLKVDAEGKATKESYYVKGTYIDFVVGKLIRNAVDEALKAWVIENQEKIKDRLMVALKKQNSRLAAAIVNGLAKSIENSYDFECNVNFREKQKTEGE